MNRILAWFLVALIFAMSGPLQAATMASARGFEKSLYGRSAAWADKYAYCSGDPINASDPSGLEPEEFSAYQKFILKKGVNIATRFGHKGKQIDFWRFSVGSGPLHVASKYSRTGGYTMETTPVGNVNVNKQWFDKETHFADQEDSSLPFIVGAIANETYHIRHPEDTSPLAEHRSDLYELEVLESWQKSLKGSKTRMLSSGIDDAIREVKDRMMGGVPEFDKIERERANKGRYFWPGPWWWP